MTCYIKENTLPKYVKEFLKNQNIEIPRYGFQYDPKHLASDNKAKIFVPKLDVWLHFEDVKEKNKPFGKWEEKDFALALSKMNIGKQVKITYECNSTNINIKKAELTNSKVKETIEGELTNISELTYTVKYFDKQRKEDLSQNILKSMVTEVAYI